MKNRKWFQTLILVFVPIFSPLMLAQSASLDDCQKLKERIEKYTELRRGGGSAERMDAWKRSRTRAEEMFRENDCHWYGNELK